MKNKTVGVLTFHRSLNYGAVLQAYGLVKSIEKLGYECDLIDYRNPIMEEKDSVKRFFKRKSLIVAAFQIIEMPFWFIRRKKFNEFLRLSNLSNRVEKIDRQIEQKYSDFFVGSDQVWNYKVTGLDMNYFFNEIENRSKKNSYAASFGVSTIPDNLHDVYKDGLNGLNNISVREPEGALIVKELTGVEPKVVIDPSFLISKEEWVSLLHNKKRIDGNYIVIYQRAYSASLIEFAKELSDKTNCKIVTINGNPRQFVRAKYILDAGPIDFLNILHNAKYVVTNSFHGVALSINLNKNFYVELLDEKFGVNSRLNNIINFFSIENRMIKKGHKIEDIKDIDFLYINDKLKAARSDSLAFLKESLERN